MCDLNPQMRAKRGPYHKCDCRTLQQVNPDINTPPDESTLLHLFNGPEPKICHSVYVLCSLPNGLAKCHVVLSMF